MLVVAASLIFFSLVVDALLSMNKCKGKRQTLLKWRTSNKSNAKAAQNHGQKPKFHILEVKNNK